MEQNKLQSAVEAILFALGVPVETGRLCQALETDRETVEAACRALGESYEARDAGIRLACLEDSWQLTSAPEWGEAIRALLSRRKPDKLSPAALETLTVVAYFQPVTRVYIDQVRGVDSAHSVALLLDREGETDRVFAGLTADEMTVAEKVFQTVAANLQEITQ